MNNWSSQLLSYLSKRYPTTKENIENTKEIILDYQIIREINKDIKDYIEVFSNVEKLAMSSCKLSSLKNLPCFPNLTKIELNDNYLTEKEIIKLCQYPMLSELYIANNRINSFEELKGLSKMRELHLLDLSENPLCKKKDYRETMFEIFPRLVFLDGVGKNNEVYEDFLDENEEEEEEENENEEDKDFIEDKIEEEESEEEESEEEENNNEEENEEEEDDDEIENPNPSKKKKIK